MTLLGRLATVVGGLVLGTLVVWALSSPRLEPTWLSAGAASVSALFAVITASVAMASLRQVRRDSQESSRPMVVVDLERTEAETLPGADDAPDEADQYQDIVIRNLGSSVARNVRVAFDPEVPDTEGAHPAIDLLLELFGKPRTLIPGTELRTVYRGPIGLPTPPQVDAVVTYDDGRGHDYDDRFTLDVRTVETRTRLVVGRRRGGPSPIPGSFGAAPPMAEQEPPPFAPGLADAPRHPTEPS